MTDPARRTTDRLVAFCFPLSWVCVPLSGPIHVQIPEDEIRTGVAYVATQQLLLGKEEPKLKREPSRWPTK